MDNRFYKPPLELVAPATFLSARLSSLLLRPPACTLRRGSPPVAAGWRDVWPRALCGAAVAFAVGPASAQWGRLIGAPVTPARPPAATAAPTAPAAAPAPAPARSAAPVPQWGTPLKGATPAAAGVAATAATAPTALGKVDPSRLPLAENGIELRLAQSLKPLPKGDAAKQLPIVVQAQSLRGRPDLETLAEGDALLRRGDVSIRADSLSYDQTEDLAVARGNVDIKQDKNRYGGPELQLKIQRFEGYFLNPTYFFGLTSAGGTAERIDFIGSQRTVATQATYSSCPADGSGDPAWLLTSDRVDMDFDTNEGIADGAVLRFLGVPILWAPQLSFPLTDERKSGWLPPSFAIDSTAGVQVEAPYYWNIAPNRDATLTPSASLRRGPGLATEFRYLESNYDGQLNLNLVPNDRVADRARWSFGSRHDAEWADDTRLSLRLRQVSDNDYWKDFSREEGNLTPRLLLSDLQVTRPFGDWTTYARAQRWQVLQNIDSRIESPYQRLPQIGARTIQAVGDGFDIAFEGEFNRFANWDKTEEKALTDTALNPRRPEGIRLHALASISRSWVSPGWTLTPKLTLNAASYNLDRPYLDNGLPDSDINAYRSGKSISRVIPTFSIDSAWALERESNWFGKDLLQTLEPRLLYVNTPYRKQDDFPIFDSAGRDLNFETIFSENAFSGIDRVSDSHEVTGGVTTRWLDPQTGAESLRLGVAQRYLFRDQRVTITGDKLTQRVSDLLLLGSTSVIPNWTVSGSLQYNPQIGSPVRSVMGASYSPGPFRTISGIYRQTRGASEQVEAGWQWPLYGRTPAEAGIADDGRGNAGSCLGSLYTVGRVNYSTRDSRIVDAILGFEYDAGCWIGRLVAERLSTGRSEATTRLLFQLELVGLSRIGSNPLQVLKDNVPGYRLLRDGPQTPQSTNLLYE